MKQSKLNKLTIGKFLMSICQERCDNKKKKQTASAQFFK